MPQWMQEELDELIDQYQFGDDMVTKVHRTMRNREETFKDEMEGIRENLKSARSPPALLTALLKEIEQGNFKPRFSPEYAQKKQREARERKCGEPPKEDEQREDKDVDRPGERRSIKERYADQQQERNNLRNKQQRDPQRSKS